MAPDQPCDRTGGDDRDEVAPAYARLLDKLSVEDHFDFRQYKVGTLVRRIHSRLSQLRIDDVETYIALLDRQPDEAHALFNTILINVTAFFRDPEAWEALGQQVVPRLLANAESTGALRVWSAGCSTGEEAYSVALLLAEQLGGRGAGRT